MADRLTLAIQTLVGVFHEYASKDQEEKAKGKGEQEVEGGCKGPCMEEFTLSKRELKELMQKELNMDNVSDPLKLEELMRELDDNGDGQVDFTEFVTFVATMACVCNNFLEMILSGEDIDCV